MQSGRVGMGSAMSDRQFDSCCWTIHPRCSDDLALPALARPTLPCPALAHLAEHHLKSTPAQRVPSMPQASLDCEHPPDWLPFHLVSSCPAFPATNRHNGRICRRHSDSSLGSPHHTCLPHLASTRTTQPDSRSRRAAVAAAVGSRGPRDQPSPRFLPLAWKTGTRSTIRQGLQLSRPPSSIATTKLSAS